MFLIRELFKKLRREKLRPKNTTGGAGGGQRCQKDTTVPTKSDIYAISTKNSRISTIVWQKNDTRGGGGGVGFFRRNFSRLSFLNISLSAIWQNMDFKETNLLFWFFSSVIFVTCRFFWSIVKGLGKNPLFRVPTCWHSRSLQVGYGRKNRKSPK